MPTIFDAIEFATRAHAGQFRKGTRIPYIVHPLAVARILIEHDAPDNVVFAAVLHDVIEDTNATLAQVRAAFGDEVARLVQGMSEPNRQDTWENRKHHTLTFMETAPLNVLLIKVADQLDNIRSLRQDYAQQGEAIWQRFHRGREKQEWYYKRMFDVLHRRLASAQTIGLLQELEANVRAVFDETARH
jgi:(p)ppGpp synthase/HD superfamily hydrolase